MRSLIYSMGVSLDGYIAAPGDDISWSVPSDELFRFHIEQVREVGVQLCGRKLYETMRFWESAHERPDVKPEMLEFQSVWVDTPKVVFSGTLESAEGARLVRGDAIEEVRRLKAEDGAALAIGGAGLGRSLMAAGLVDELRLFLHPIVLGAGTPFFPALQQPFELALLETQKFTGGVMYLRYAARR
jgi:dihydrofolate reductase